MKTKTIKKSASSLFWGILGGLLPLGLFLLTLGDPVTDLKSTNTDTTNAATPVSHVNYSPFNIDTSTDFTVASEKSVHSVVHVKTKVVQKYVQRDPFLEFFYGPGAGRERKQYGEGSGSGVIISDDGYIVTNNHVIQNASDVEITLNDNTTYPAEIVGVDPSTDLAVLKVEASNLEPIPFANSDDVKVGEWVLAVGNPFNLNSTVTAGIVSAKARNINIIGSQKKDVIPIESFIQTDAAVNPGNSGGALVNSNGELIGINTAIASQTGNYAGYSFAVPSRLVSKITSDIVDYGMVQRAFLGLQIKEINQSLKDEKALESTQGVYINKINEGSSAEDGGLKEGDVILKIGSKSVNAPSQLQEEVGKRRPGDQVAVTLKRGEQVLTKKLVLRNKEGNTALKSKEEVERYSALGATFGDLSDDEMRELNVDHGVKITSISAGKLRSLGLTEGMIITKVNNEKVTSVEELTHALNGEHNNGVLLEIMNESGRKDYVGFGL
ncbi:MAG: trypsin-like peptidase domain-containing protein [Bacteroidota bacterium]